MNDSKKYWCFNCNSECQINIIKEDDEEIYQCSKCKNTFIEEISNEDNPKNFHIEQPHSETNTPQNENQNGNQNENNINSINNYNINISDINQINANNNIQNNSNNINEENDQTQYEYGMDNTLLFLPSTVKCIVKNNHRNANNLNTLNTLNNFLNSSSSYEIVTQIVVPSNNSNNSNNIYITNLFNRNRPMLGFLSNHNNDNQFENLLNIIMSFDSIHKGNPPASEKAINNLKKTDINKDNIKDYNEKTCNVCLENYKEGDISIKLDCEHYFHDKCIIQWLKMRNTCPVCRHELESNDPNYEKRKHSHRETLRNFHNNYGNGNNNGNNNNNNGAQATA